MKLEALAALHRRPLWRLLSLLSPFRPPTAYEINLAVALETVPQINGRDDTPARFAS